MAFPVGLDDMDCLGPLPARYIVANNKLPAVLVSTHTAYAYVRGNGYIHAYSGRVFVRELVWFGNWYTCRDMSIYACTVF